MIADIQRKAQELLSQNASAILTAGGVVGTVGTAVLAGRASYKVGQLVTVAAYDREENPDSTEEPNAWIKIKVLGPYFVPPVILGGATIASIIMANQVSAKRAAALAAAYSISERRLDEYKAKTLEKLGVNKEEKLRDEIAQDMVTNDPPEGPVIIISGNKVLAKDALTGRYFQTTVEDIRKAENMINTAMLNHEYASLSEFYENLDLEPTGYSDEVGWNLSRNGPLEVKITSAVAPDGQPTLVIDFNTAPHPAYSNLGY